MKKNTIVHFVGFITTLEPDDFAPNWERYAKRLNKKKDSTFQQHITERKNKLSYLSQHEWDEPGSNFTFMNERKSEHFPEHNVRVMQLGGYLRLDPPKKQSPGEGDTKLIAFISHEENDMEFYRQLPCRGLHINQAYYESCTYGYILEFFVAEADVDELSEQLKQRQGVETGIYREYVLSHA
ncbi:MAG TPA: hypothetical protein VGO58_13225 [Chitinophagaceae bacterium]|jgi:hypothetical protein|nr:hypothetical protein [Chitinophagaceae bacterium]